MSKMSKVAGRVGAISVAVAAAAAVTAGSANAAPLPNGQKTVAAPEGWSIVLKSTGNSFKIQPSLATAQTRDTWVSSTGSVSVKAPADAEIQGKLGIGFVKGCQFPGQIGVGIGIDGPGVGLGTGITGSLGSVSPSLTVPLSPGTTSSVTGYGRGDQPASIDSIKFKKAGTYEVVLKDTSIGFGHCSGYAQARLVTWVELKGSNRVQGFLYGAPFSLG